ncbi:DUF2235 domain-containing protein, partial [Pectobacterium versatile]|uniref:DUF2235 domain-containing protein n=1 Tax=Pectobacterium versatile TaxID=2488639 RepID=UPI001FFC6AF2
FVGIFDTVASSYHPSLNIRLQDDCAERVVHLTALDEVRKHFPLTRITPTAIGTSIPAHYRTGTAGCTLRSWRRVLQPLEPA